MTNKTNKRLYLRNSSVYVYTAEEAKRVFLVVVLLVYWSKRLRETCHGRYKNLSCVTVLNISGLSDIWQ